ncbi:putative porin [Aquimarina sp. U1-2]|uniref:putative porin n=1 Tax=Aquimarina sp. U1-2 TaxID=2823141 RepID=UPI001AECB889|nr:putative porin [Aquimarina sp. U1-2]MBP2831539.1 putative porin [Aquimarina sp. U1-2]
MKKILIILVALLSSSLLRAQVGNPEETGTQSKGPERKFAPKEKRDKPPISDYKIITVQNDTTYVDTTLTLQKDYKFNYLRRDDFELQPIHNVGQSYNSLVKQEERDRLLPLFGARARHFNFMEVEDINYYHVPTPLTELYFRTTFEQGQQLDAFFTVNTSPRLNLSLAYKGVRSLGKYQHALTSTGNFRSTLNYTTKNNRYRIKSHFVSQDLLNEENGGLSNQGLEQYLALGAFSSDQAQEDFQDRGAISVNFENAENILLGKRFYLDHEFAVLHQTDSTDTTELTVGHILDLSDKSYRFDQTQPNDLFGQSYESTAVADDVALEDFSNQVFLEFKNKWLGKIKIIGSSSNYNYGYNTILSQIDAEGNPINIVNRLKGEIYAIGGAYQNTYKGFQLFADGMSIVSGEFEGNYVNAGAGFSLNDRYQLHAKISTSSVAPNYNFLLYQSDYINYNWQNNFENVATQKVQVRLKATKIADIEASYSTIDNFTYFTKDADSITVPRQASESINLLKVKLVQGVKWWKLGLENTIMYQSVSGGNQIYNVPEIITRNSLYFEDYWFKNNALFLQTGVTLKYFSAYNADGYDPVLAEFYTQNEQEIGGFPQIDIFFNAKVKQTRVYFKVENFGEAFGSNNEFSAPRYATRDAVIRFGLVWNFFL